MHKRPGALDNCRTLRQRSPPCLAPRDFSRQQINSRDTQRRVLWVETMYFVRLLRFFRIRWCAVRLAVD
jgi:hypothetical protein